MRVDRNIRIIQSIAKDGDAKDADRLRAAIYLVEHHLEHSEGVGINRAKAATVTDIKSKMQALGGS